MSIIKEFYYGNINPSSPLNRPTSFEYQDITYRLKAEEAILNNMLGEKDKNHFEDFCKYHQKLTALLSAENFEKGFCLGAQISIAAMSNEQYDR